MYPLFFSISPKSAEIRDDLPHPTCPTTATKEPGLTEKLMLLEKEQEYVM